jgi:hypothetical protein
MALAEQALAEMESNESCAAGNKYAAHAVALLMSTVGPRYFFARAGLRGQVQRAGFGTSFRASSMCSPQPSQVGFLQILQVIFLHMARS